MKLLVVLAFLAAAVTASKRYDGYQLYSVTPKDQSSFNALVALFEKSDNYDFWTEPRGVGHAIDIMVPPAYQSRFVDVLKVFGMDYRLKSANIQNLIDLARKDQATGLSASGRYSIDWENYYDYNAIVAFINEIAAAHPDKVTVTSVGKSYENRDMPLVKISTGGSGKKAIFVDGGIHAREWISPAFVTWLINELVENYAAHPQYVDKVDWYIMPVINPDGYAYSHATDRLWRKNRRPVSALCYGTDMNRNFGFHWNEGGSSNSPCADTYHGGAAFSEIESQNVRDVILGIASQTQVYLTFHSYGQYWLTPWGYTSALPDDYPQLFSLATNAVNALTAVYGTKYTIGSSTNVLYVASGGSDDWAKGGAGIPYSYTVEMRDEGTFGFQLPARQIIPNNLEVWEGVKVVADSVIAGY